ncbi:MAG: ABC transporter ATP-binding protein [FCB group bacterium]|nr:ABC transporter ATP-binding protein [FCB group bacterium]MBL7028736.1 ABC transporter ATP-binding protein [Candidatus Neomarinimicrobiota bacterium]MBL7120660.1 ABC transporter ATP-binding protein [Candidatus Neomarinimicrobiota bacterium]
MSREKLVEVKGLKTRFKVGGEWAKAVDGVSFDIYEGETLGIVGESGSGKSVSVLSLIQLIPNPPGEVSDGEIIFKGQKIFDADDLARVRVEPPYKYFPKLPEEKRNTAAGFFFLAWMLIHISLPISGLGWGLLSLVLNLSVMVHLFYNSPRNVAMAEFRQNIYSRMWDIRGSEIAMIFQEPMTSLNPVFNIGMQTMEAIRPTSLKDSLKAWFVSRAKNLKSYSFKNRAQTSGVFAVIALAFSQLAAGWSFNPLSMLISLIVGGLVPTGIAYFIIGIDKLISDEFKSRHQELFNAAVKLLDTVGIPDAERRMGDYPHQFSGGMRQRVMIAMALAKNPSLLIADEPTTALDVTIQAQILDLMLDLKKHNTEAAVVLITHDLAVVAETCERVIVMYGGVIQEIAEVNDLFSKPMHPYTNGLLGSIPRPDIHSKRERLETIPGMVPNILDLPVGCKFCTRCTVKLDKCDTEEPPLQEITPGHFVRCFVTQEEQVSA